MENIFLDYYKETKNQINKYITNFNDELLKEDNLLLKEQLELFANLNSDGKLIRGTLVNLGYKLKNEDTSYSYPLSLAFEIFQTAILVHDDIIDNDDVRREKITVHAYNYNKYNDKELGNNIGICIGDLGLYHANQIISKSYKNDSNLGNILTYFNDVVINTIKGELLDVILPFREKNNLSIDNLEDNIMKIYELKTSYYTIVGPLSLGLILGNATKEQLKDIEKFGYYIGVAFQMQDDLLGIYGENIGKKIGSDIEEYKQTILYSYIKNTKYYDELLKYYGKEINENNLKNVRELFDISGSKKYTEDKIEEYYNKGIEILNNINWISNNNKEILKNFVIYLKSRKK